MYGIGTWRAVGQQANAGRKPRQERSLVRSGVQDISPCSSAVWCSSLRQNDHPLLNDSKTQRFCSVQTPLHYLEAKTGMSAKARREPEGWFPESSEMFYVDVYALTKYAFPCAGRLHCGLHSCFSLQPTY